MWSKEEKVNDLIHVSRDRCVYVKQCTSFDIP